ncbi:hypothetical protein KFE80_10055 [bacterium SCSIO 12696]|nr:hypothetical protein KFE80_10055 [bacterium SCSIO 12696]
MSLVNNMLRDLEERQDTTGQPPGISAALEAHKEPSPHGSKLSLTIGLSLFTCAAVLLSWHNNWWQAPEAKVPTASLQAATQVEPEATTTESAIPQPAVIETIAPASIDASQATKQTVAKPVETAKVAEIIEPDKTTLDAPTQAVVEVSASEQPPQQAPIETRPQVTTATAETAPEPQNSEQQSTERQNPESQSPVQTQVATSAATEQRQAVQAQARALLSRGDLAAAALQLQSIQPDMGQHPEHYALLAGIYHKQGQHQQAAELYSELVGFEQDNAIYWLGLAVALDAMQDRNALGAFQTTRQLNSNPDVAAYVEQRIQQLKNPG